MDNVFVTFEACMSGGEGELVEGYMGVWSDITYLIPSATEFMKTVVLFPSH